MIDGKLTLDALWLVALVSCCVLPFGLLSDCPPTLRAAVRLAPWVFGVALMFGSATLFFVRGYDEPPAVSSPLVLSLAFVAPLMSGVTSAWAGLGGLAALPLLSAVTWWDPHIALRLSRGVAFATIGVLAAMLPRAPFSFAGLPPAPALAVSIALGVISATLMGQFNSPTLFWAIWHHWGAYIAPAQAMLAGGEPFRDFPVQYGMGPTLLISALGAWDLWFGVYLETAIANVSYLLAMVACIGLALRRSPRGLALLASIAMTCGIVLWTGYPADFSGAMMTPSVSGMRFLPLALLILVIFWGESAHRSILFVGYALWFFGLAWSPEAGIYATIVWFPYLALRDARAGGSDSPGVVALVALRGAAIAVAALVVGFASLALVFRAGFGEWPSPSGFLTYVLNPPGALPPNFLGPIWIVVAAIGLGTVALTRADPKELLAGAACLLGLVAVSSYYLGRSHDNNVLNLLPFVVLLVSFALSTPLAPLLRGFAILVLVGVVAWPATFGALAWSGALRNGDALAVGPAQILERFRLATPDAWALLDGGLAAQPGPYSASADAGAALSWFAEQGAEAPVVVSKAMIMPRSARGPSWTGVNNLANFDPLPRDTIIRFIEAGSKTYHRSGWLLVDNNQPGDWVDLFSSAYTRVEERKFGGYTAYRLAPK
jgi:hypothetical protein